jgi:diguanylate cyclase (GGDEF)-like protein
VSRRSAPCCARAALGILLIGVVGYAVTTVVPEHPEPIKVLDRWLHPALMLSAAGLVAARAWWVRDERWAWSLIAVGMILPGLRNLVFAVWGPSQLSDFRPLWLCFYPFVYIGLVSLLRTRLKRPPAALWLDALVAASTAAAVGAIAFDPYLAATRGTPFQVLVELAFPVGDLLLLAAAVGALSALGWRAEHRWGLLVAGFMLYAVADILFKFAIANGTYFRGIWFDAFRPAAALLLAAASWLAPNSRRPIGRSGGVVPPLVFTTTLVGLLLLDHDAALPRAAGVLAAVGLIAVTARFGLAFREVSKLAESHRHAMTDDLTMVANRRAMTTALTAASFAYSADDVGDRNRPGPGLLLLDLDRFKVVNDSLGHHVGDQLLCQVSDRLSTSVRQGDLLARVGGDEFAVLLTAGVDLTAAQALATRMVQELGEPFCLDEITVNVEASIGIALCPQHCTDPQDLLQRADVAMYRAKGLPSRIAVYDTTYDSQRVDERQTIEELRSAISAGQLTCYYQPKVSAEDGQVHSVEALVRWKHPTRGLLPPDQFLPHAEQGGLMRPLASAVLDLALRQARSWRDRGVMMTVAVNLSVMNLLDVDLVAEIGDLLHTHRLPADALIVEITEGALTSESVRSRGVVEALQRLGIKLSIDDFGTGWSSLARLQDMTVDELKLDEVFVRRITEDPRSVAIVCSTVLLAHSLGASLVAEGVEDADTLHTLRRYGCDITQGYVHSPPLPVEKLEQWLSALRSEPSRIN